jgi:hypothetical protein
MQSSFFVTVDKISQASLVNRQDAFGVSRLLHHCRMPHSLLKFLIARQM